MPSSEGAELKAANADVGWQQNMSAHKTLKVSTCLVILVKSVVFAAEAASLHGNVPDALSQKFGLILAALRLPLANCLTSAVLRPPIVCWGSLVCSDSIPVGKSIPAYTASRLAPDVIAEHSLTHALLKAKSS